MTAPLTFNASRRISALSDPDSGKGDGAATTDAVSLDSAAASGSSRAVATANTAYKFFTADVMGSEQATSWRAAQSMTLVLLVVTLGAMLLRTLALLPALVLARRRSKQLPQLLVFPVIEHTLMELVILPLSLASLVVLLVPGPSVRYKLAATAGLLLVLGYQALVYSALVPVAWRKQGLGLHYVTGNPDSA
jgi:hypothetical protein